MPNIETNATMKNGRLIMIQQRKFRVRCTHCLEATHELFAAEYTSAGKMLKRRGWDEVHGIWTCPACKEGTDEN